VAGVGVIVNPWAGKDVRRLHAAVGHTPDTAKIGVVRRIVIGAMEAGADRVHLAADVGRIAQRAAAGLDGAAFVAGPETGSALDTRRAAGQLAELGCAVVVGLGGDGTCRDIAIGWPDVHLIPVSTGTNNVFPRFIDGTSAGVAAGFVASGRVDGNAVTVRAKRLVVDLSTGERDIALVDVAVLRGDRTGARAVVDATSVLAVVAAIATPTSTGLSSIAGRSAPLGPADDAVVIRAGPLGRVVRVPLLPGRFDEFTIESIQPLGPGATVTFEGPCVLAYDGERERPVRAGTTATVSVDRHGPFVVDVDRTLDLAAAGRLFDRSLPEAL
jgi:predicted polyphosphate/ATP-dependent NAD kinase